MWNKLPSSIFTLCLDFKKACKSYECTKIQSSLKNIVIVCLILYLHVKDLIRDTCCTPNKSPSYSHVL